MRTGLRFSCLATGFLLSVSCFGAPILVDHRHTDVAALTAAQINRAKSTLHIAYGHTSHGSQLTDGMTGLVDFANNGGLGLALPTDIFAWNDGGSGGALDLHDYAMPDDVGYYPDWVNHTRAYLDDPANANVNVVIWSWCGQMDDKYAAGTLNSEYLQPMAALEQSYPNVTFVYMTGHVDIWDDANNKAACQVIRAWCSTGNRVLYDFNDIEHYDPAGTYYPFVNDDCGVYDAAGGTQTGNWATAWQNSHVENVDWYNCGSAHSEPLNANRKAYAAWALWCRIAERLQSPALSVSPVGRAHSAAGASGQLLQVAANVPWTATASSPWISISSGAAGSGNGTVTYGVAANAGAVRAGTITVTGGGITRTFAVNQWPVPATPGVSAEGDVDGDGAADFSVFHPATGNWHVLFGAGARWVLPWGWAATVPVPADYNGDGMLDFAVYHPATGNWHIQNSGSVGARVVQFGWSTTVPLPGDYDGDGKADLAVFHQAQGRWHFLCTTAGRYSVPWGWSTTIPVPADYDGDGKIDIAVYHPPSGLWQILKSSTGGAIQKTWGWSTALPVPADYDGDGKADVAVFHRETGTWRIFYSGGGSRTKQFGWSSTIPVAADYDGDGAADLAVYHPATGNWHILKSTTGGIRVQNWGWSAAKPTLLYPLIHSWFGLP